MIAPRSLLSFVVLCAPLALSNCRSSDDDAKSSGAEIPATFWSEEPLAGAVATAKARAEAKDGETLVVEGRIKDFVAGRAVFTLIDTELKSCREVEGDACKTPWDYCCIEPNRIAQNTVTVELHDENGQPLRANMAGAHGLDHLDLVRVRGTVSRDEAGNVTLVAAAIDRS